MEYFKRVMGKGGGNNTPLGNIKGYPTYPSQRIVSPQCMNWNGGGGGGYIRMSGQEGFGNVDNE